MPKMRNALLAAGAVLMAASVRSAVERDRRMDAYLRANLPDYTEPADGDDFCGSVW